MRRGQHRRLRDAGIGTLRTLAAAPADLRIPKLAAATFAGLREQAALQVESSERGRLLWRARELEEGRGFNCLPPPSPGDVVLDLEGDPLWEPGRGLVFLFGLLELDRPYVAFWAHDAEGERRAFEQVVDRVRGRLARWPGFHVYHYGSYDAAALKRLMGEHGTREDEIDDLLRRGVLVDLYTVLRQALRAGVPSYSLKQTERLAGFERSAELASGSDAVVDYETWRSTRDHALLERIAACNEEDCRATLALLDWLRRERPRGLPWPKPSGPRELPEETRERIEARDRLRLELTEGEEPGSPRWLAGALLEYHRREARPAWWAHFARLEMSAEELLEDPECIGGLVPDADVPPEPLRRSLVHTLRFPPEQQHKLAAGDQPVAPATEGVAGTILELDLATGRLRLLRGPSLADVLLPTALLPPKALTTLPQQAALERLACSVRDGDGRYRALEDLLARARPRVRGREPGSRLQTMDLNELCDLAESLEESHLFVQGPPGSGKTYRGAHRPPAARTRAARRCRRAEPQGDPQAPRGAGGARRRRDPRPQEGDGRGPVVLRGLGRRERDRDRALRRSCHPPARGHRVALLPRGARRSARRPRPRRGGPALARGRPGDGHVRTEPRPPRRPAPARAGLAGDAPARNGRVRARAPPGGRPDHPRGPGRLRRGDAAHARGRVPLRLRDRLRGTAPPGRGVQPPGHRGRDGDPVPAGRARGKPGAVRGEGEGHRGGDRPAARRFNVAISRARCLAYLVCSPRLLEARPRTVEEMRLVNALCRLVELAEEQTKGHGMPANR